MTVNDELKVVLLGDKGYKLANSLSGSSTAYHYYKDLKVLAFNERINKQGIG